MSDQETIRSLRRANMRLMEINDRLWAQYIKLGERTAVYCDLLDKHGIKIPIPKLTKREKKAKKRKQKAITTKVVKPPKDKGHPDRPGAEPMPIELETPQCVAERAPVGM